MEAKSDTQVQNSDDYKGFMGHAVVYGSPEERDLAGFYATKESNHGEQIELPILYHFWTDATHVFERMIGRTVLIEERKDGIFVKCEWVLEEIDESLVHSLKQIIDKGLLHFAPSSDAEEVVISEDGHYDAFPMYALFLTPMPSLPPSD